MGARHLAKTVGCSESEASLGSKQFKTIQNAISGITAFTLDKPSSRHRSACYLDTVEVCGVRVRTRFGKAVRAKREAISVSQKEFAHICGLGRAYIGSIERGERNVALVNIEKIAKELRVSLSELFRKV